MNNSNQPSSAPGPSYSSYPLTLELAPPSDQKSDDLLNLPYNPAFLPSTPLHYSTSELPPYSTSSSSAYYPHDRNNNPKQQHQFSNDQFQQGNYPAVINAYVPQSLSAAAADPPQVNAAICNQNSSGNNLTVKEHNDNVSEFNGQEFKHAKNLCIIVVVVIIIVCFFVAISNGTGSGGGYRSHGGSHYHSTIKFKVKNKYSWKSKRG